MIAVFYIQKGKVRLTVVSKNGKEATIGILNPGDFFGEGGLAGQPLRMGSATAMTDCELMRIEKSAMILALHREHTFSEMFVAYLLRRNIRYEAVLVDQLFNFSEKPTARIRLLLAHAARKDSELESGNSVRNGGVLFTKTAGCKSTVHFLTSSCMINPF